MGLFSRTPAAPPRRRVHAIRREVLEMIAASARATHPNEFGAAMRAEGGVITELVLVPGTIAGDAHTFLPLGSLPIDASLVGTIHSHPGPEAIPSDADKQLFNAFGHTHVIMAMPYDEESWIAYDQNAREIVLDVVD